MSQFIKDLLRPHVLDTSLGAGYQAMTADREREIQAKDWQEAAEILMQNGSLLPQRKQTRQEVIAYMKSRRGGTEKTCATINTLLL